MQLPMLTAWYNQTVAADDNTGDLGRPVDVRFFFVVAKPYSVNGALDVPQVCRANMLP